jgi:hypothetical protein
MNTRLFQMIGLFAIISLLTACSINAEKVSWGKVTAEEWQIGKPADYPEANAVVLFDVCSLSVHVEGGISVSRWKRIKIFNKTGAEEIGEISLKIFSDDKINDLRAQTILKNGKVISFNRKDFTAKSSGDYRKRTFSFPPLDSEYIVEFQFDYASQIWYYLPPWCFQSDIYTIKSSITYIAERGFLVNYFCDNMPEPKKNPIEGKMPNPDDPVYPDRTLTWELNNLKPTAPEPYAFAEADHIPTLYLQLKSYEGVMEDNTPNNGYFIKHWNEQGRDFQTRINLYTQGTNLADLSKQIVGSVNTPIEKIKLLNEYVENQVKSKPDEFENWFTNENLSLLLKNGVGTRAEKNILLTELLKTAGFQAWPVLISTRGHRRLIPELCQLNVFNHILSFVQFDSTSLYLDASNKYCPIGMLPPECLVESGLLIDGEKPAFVKILSNVPKTYRLDVTYMQLNDTRTVSCSTVSVMGGYFSPEYAELADSLSKTDFFKKYFLDELNATYTLDTVDISSDSTGKFITVAKYTLNDFVTDHDNNMMLNLVNFRFRSNPFTKAERLFPIDFNFPFIYQNTVFIQSNKPFVSVTVPPDTVFQIKGASFTRLSKSTDTLIQIDNRLTMSNATYSQLAYSTIKQFFELISEMQLSNVVFMGK